MGLAGGQQGVFCEAEELNIEILTLRGVYECQRLTLPSELDAIEREQETRIQQGEEIVMGCQGITKQST